MRCVHLRPHAYMYVKNVLMSYVSEQNYLQLVVIIEMSIQQCQSIRTHCMSLLRKRNV